MNKNKNNSKKYSHKKKLFFLILGIITIFIQSLAVPQAESFDKGDYNLIPPFVSAGVPPLVMLVMSRNHKLYYEAYNDASDLDGDGNLDVGYNPNIDYYGYFDSYKVYTYSSANKRFEPVAKTLDKKVLAAGQWSGDFLNYATMSRMDCLRKVLYGGYRSIDTATETVLERVYIPQDTHSWGKEYRSIGIDHYDIREYTPLDLPKVIAGHPEVKIRHLFASTNLDGATIDNPGPPILRVLPNNSHRIWDWVASEVQVCDNRNPQMTISNSANSAKSPKNHGAYDTFVFNHTQKEVLLGKGLAQKIDGSGNPYGSNSHYLNIFKGKINVTTAGEYELAVDGSDAVELIIFGKPKIENYDKSKSIWRNDRRVIFGYYNSHLMCNCTTHNKKFKLNAGQYRIEFRHESQSGPGKYRLSWKGPDSSNIWKTIPDTVYRNLTQECYNVVELPVSKIDDKIIRVKVGVPGLVENNCKKYKNGTYKPIGLLQRHGESERMMFGLITGSYNKNHAGGVLRKNIGSITDEIDPLTGKIIAPADGGIIDTINKLKTVDFKRTYKSTKMWGNPIAEMMYEGLRYFAGKKAPTSAFTYDSTNTNIRDNKLGLPLPAWKDPYEIIKDASGNITDGFSRCAKPFMLVISDTGPSYDSDQLPGVNTNFGNFTGDVTGLNVSSAASTISGTEQISGKKYYIGQSGTDYNGAPTPKTVNSLGSIRGLSPEEPTKKGSYYSASIAYYGRINDVSSALGDQNIITYSVALASPLPRIKIPVGNNKFVTLAPFAKTVKKNATQAQMDKAPTCSIVDFFVENITQTSGAFTIDYGDAEQGADYDMDAMARYTYEVINNGTQVKITLDSTYSQTSGTQHLGYVISGTTKDGIYLDIRYADNLYHPTGPNDYVDFFLDTPSNFTGTPPPPQSIWKDNDFLPVSSIRIFDVGSTSGAEFLRNPLWYAAKWGAFEEDSNNRVPNNEPDYQDEWDKDGDLTPDTYFYVSNPLKLEKQLNRSFADILRRTVSGTAASVISSSRSGEGAIYQAIFYPEYKGDQGHTVNWVGNVNTYLIDPYGNMREDSNRNRTLDLVDDKIIKFNGTTVYKYTDANGNGRLDPSEKISDPNNPNNPNNPVTTDILGIDFLWSAGDWLNTVADSDILTQRNYTGTTKQRFIFTFLDNDADMVADDTTIDNIGEVLNFTDNQSVLYPYIHVIPHPFEIISPPTYLKDAGILGAGGTVTNSAAYTSYADAQAKRVIKYIRGQDQGEDTTTISKTIPAMRSRRVNYPDSTKVTDNTVDTWRLGDIVYSTPTVVGRPAEHYDLLYDDSSYTPFRILYRNRRQVAYVGANDGMLHAFNGGFYDNNTKKFWLNYNSSNSTFSDTGLDLGAELWAYVPTNQLSHLSWLTENDYNTDYHVAYVDLKPKIFDAKIFSTDTDHPNGWGTVMVVGMRFGGGLIAADTDRDNTILNASGAAEPVFKSAYIIMDITNPETAPKLLAELTLPKLGYTTCYPTVIPMKDKDSTKDKNDWYLVFGSGPAGSTGLPAGSTALKEASSKQKGRIYVLDLKWLVAHKEIKMLDSSGTATAGVQTFAELDNNSFISDPITIDYNLDYKADTLYFGTVSGNTSKWGGKLRRLLIKNNDITSTWNGNSVLVDLGSMHSGQPIVAAPAVGVDDLQNRWVFFGTGRFFNRLDITAASANHQQSFYGIKEDRTINATTGASIWNWSTVSTADLLDVTGVGVIEGGASVFDTKGTPTVTVTDFNGLVSAVEAKDGWRLDFDNNTERNLGQAALLGGLLSFTTYDPSNDACTIEGSSYLYALFYKTGTAYKESVMGTTTTGTEISVDKFIKLGKGLTITPNIHRGKGEGTKAFIQTSTGAIVGIKQTNPLPVKSGEVYWMERMED